MSSGINMFTAVNCNFKTVCLQSPTILVIKNHYCAVKYLFNFYLSCIECCKYKCCENMLEKYFKTYNYSVIHNFTTKRNTTTTTQNHINSTIIIKYVLNSSSKVNYTFLFVIFFFFLQFINK